MYAKPANRKTNDPTYDQEPEQLNIGLVSSGTVIGSVTELPRVGRNKLNGFHPVGDPILYNRLASSGVTPLGSIGLAEVRKELAARFEENPNLYYGVTNQTDDVVFIQGFRREY